MRPFDSTCSNYSKYACIYPGTVKAKQDGTTFSVITISRQQGNKRRLQKAYRLSPVTDAILFIGTEFRECTPKAWD